MQATKARRTPREIKPLGARLDAAGGVRQKNYRQLSDRLAQGAKLISEDEANFRQDATLYRTWSRRGQTPLVPVTGEIVRNRGDCQKLSSRCWRNCSFLTR